MNDKKSIVEDYHHTLYRTCEQSFVLLKFVYIAIIETCKSKREKKKEKRKKDKIIIEIMKGKTFLSYIHFFLKKIDVC
jgi:hypothetical protein